MNEVVWRWRSNLKYSNCRGVLGIQLTIHKTPITARTPRSHYRRRTIHERRNRFHFILRCLQHEKYAARVCAPVVHAWRDVKGLDGTGWVFCYVDAFVGLMSDKLTCMRADEVKDGRRKSMYGRTSTPNIIPITRNPHPVLTKQHRTQVLPHFIRVMV